LFCPRFIECSIATAISSFLIFIPKKIRFKNDYFEANSTGQDRLGSGQAYPEAFDGLIIY